MLVVTGIGPESAPPLRALVREAEVVAELVCNNPYIPRRYAECTWRFGNTTVIVRGQADQVRAELVATFVDGIHVAIGRIRQSVKVRSGDVHLGLFVVWCPFRADEI